MARRTGKTSTAQAEAPAEAPVNTEEAAVSATETEAPAPTEASNTEADTKAEPDLTEFKQAVSDAVAESDTSTGDVPEASIEAVTKAYRALDGIKAKNQAKAYVNEQMANSMNEGSLAGARAHLQISEKALVAAAAGHGGTKAPADPTENFVQRVATLSLGYNLATANVPDGVDGNWTDRANQLVSDSMAQATEYLGWMNADPETRGEEPEVGAVVRNAVKLAQGKAAKAGVSRGGGSFTGERRDIGQHIVSAFESKEVGDFLTIAEIRNTRSDEYGDNPPSAGAISARLFPKSGESSMVKVGIKPDTQNGKKGAVKVEIDES